MGLGPQVCEQCVVIFAFDDEKGWYCPICGSTKSSRHTGIGPLRDLTQYTDNLKFLQFMQGNKDVSV